MKFIRLAALTVLVLGQVSASSSQSHVGPTPIGPATSGLPFSTLSFDTTASPSLLSALSSLISSESTAINPFTSPTLSATATSASLTSGSGTPTATGSSTTQNVTTTTPTSTSTSTSGAGRAVGDVWGNGGVFVGVVIAVAALL